jgi:hypothetical protein
MNGPRWIALATIALVVRTPSLRAQGASLAAGVATAAGDFTSTAGTGIDIQLQVRTDPVIGPLPLRIDIGYDRLPGKGAISNYVITAQSVSILGDIGKRFYWAAGPGYYQLNSRITLAGRTGSSERDSFGVQAAFGVNVPVFRWDGFLEISGVRLFSQGPAVAYVPLRFGIRL